ncbi:MAG: hypothetical protein A3G87_07690 [Omnitrophica bacterium RIFCSPLOWO2_12_FULL_50_11]|nr:MAG: hypothetical protein A3G87_07690 [Omnitrophica bacterium RIFCSPLOWO2_12_FULL_50_11]
MTLFNPKKRDFYRKSGLQLSRNAGWVILQWVTVQPPTYRHSEAEGRRISKNEILRGVYSECYSAQDDGAERLLQWLVRIKAFTPQIVAKV